MEANPKAIVIICLVIIGLFAGGLWYVISEGNNRRVALELVKQYLVTNNPEEQLVLEAEIRSRIERRPIAMTSRASIDSFEQLVANARACEGYAEQAVFSQNDSREVDTNEIWRFCMDNPEVLNQRNQPR